MELLQQHEPPQPLELRCRVAVTGTHRRRGAPQFRFPEQVLAAPVPQLGPGLAGVGAPVQFEVQLPHPDRRGLVFRLGAGKEGSGSAGLHPRGTLEVRGAPGGRQHLPRGAAAAVAVAERKQGDGSPAVVPVVPFRMGQFPAAELGAVAVHRREVGEQPGAVDALPVEGVVRHPVDLVPGDLLGQEPLAARGLHDLRQRRRVPEGVGEPCFLAVDAELGQEEALAFEELAGHGLATGHVGVRLDPHAAHGDKLAGLDLLPDAAEQLRVRFLDPGELLGAGAGEHELRVLIHQRDNIGKRPGALADGLPHRPQPGGVDVRVPRGQQLMGRGIGGPCQDGGQGLAARGCGSGDVFRVQDVQHPFERAQDLVAPGQVHGQFVHKPAERPDVLLQLPHGLVELCNDDPPEAVFRFAPRGRLVAVRRCREGPALGQVGVRRRLDVEVNGFSAAQELQRDMLVPRGDGFDDGPVRPPGGAFALEPGQIGTEAQIHQDFHCGLRRRAPRVRHFPLQPQPLGAPRRAPGRSVLLRGEFLPECLHHRDRLARHIPAA